MLELEVAMVVMIEEKHRQIAELCHKYGVRRLDVFGSAATAEKFDPARSDIDLLVEYPPGHDLGPWLRDYFGLKEELERLLERPVDLVVSTAPRNPFFIRELERTRQTLYASEDAQIAGGHP